MKTTNKLGDYAESVLISKCLELGLGVSKPYSDDSRYDIITDRNSVLNRVQVKSTNTVKSDSIKSPHYEIIMSRDWKERYTKGEIDLMALYIVPEDDWYIIPIDQVKVKKFYVTIGVDSRWNKYKNNFELL